MSKAARPKGHCGRIIPAYQLPGHQRGESIVNKIYSFLFLPSLNRGTVLAAPLLVFLFKPFTPLRLGGRSGDYQKWQMGLADCGNIGWRYNPLARFKFTDWCAIFFPSYQKCGYAGIAAQGEMQRGSVIGLAGKEIHLGFPETRPGSYRKS